MTFSFGNSFLLVFLFLLGAKLPLCAQRIWQPDMDSYGAAEKEFTTFNPDFKTLKAAKIKELIQALNSIRRLEASGVKTSCSHQILWELKALVTQTASFAQIDRRFAELDSVLNNPQKDQLDSSEENLGNCYDAWFCKLNAFCDAIENGQKSLPAKTFSSLLDRVNSPKVLAHYLDSVSVSDIAHTGIDHLLEFNLSLTNLLRLILRDDPVGYPWNPKLKKEISRLVFKRFRNSRTGWWGERYVRNGKVQFVDDLSTTFHIVSYLHGNLSHLDRVLATTLAVKDLNYPVGWLWKGEYWNHNNMDVVAIFQACWQQATKEQKAAIATEIQKMLDWCLHRSLQADGSFTFNIADGSMEEAEYYGASFLKRIGFFNKEDRFWTSQEFEGAEAVRQKIIAYILNHYNSGGSGSNYYASALKDCLGYQK